MSYCRAIETMSEDKKALHKTYHDNAYGFPINDDNELFCRLVLEINQAESGAGANPLRWCRRGAG